MRRSGIKNISAFVDAALPQSAAVARRSLFTAYEEVLAAVDPFLITRKQLQINGSALCTAGHTFALGSYRRISVIGAGKAGAGMAAAIEELLGERLYDGCVNISDRCGYDLKKLETRLAGHPLPDAAGVAGAHRILEVAAAAERDDLLICLISGGGSSLLPLPSAPLTLSDKQLTTSLLLRCGASISEINTVRKHISAIKGGQLARKAWPATLLNLVLSDVLHDPLDFIASGPTVADSTTFSDALAVIEKYGLSEKVPAVVIDRLQEGIAGRIADTPKPDDSCFARVFNQVIASNVLAKRLLAENLKQLGFEVELVDAPIAGPVDVAGDFFVEALRRLSVRRLQGSRVALVAGGELTLEVHGAGRGGRNQHLALTLLEALRAYKGAIFAALSTDGIDGPTDASGAFVDASVIENADRLGLGPGDFLQRCDSYEFFRQTGGLVCTGYTGGNLNDLFVLMLT